MRVSYIFFPILLMSLKLSSTLVRWQESLGFESYVDLPRSAFAWVSSRFLQTISDLG